MLLFLTSVNRVRGLGQDTALVVLTCLCQVDIDCGLVPVITVSVGVLCVMSQDCSK